jgi:Domain of unknown function (DUF4340)
MNLGKHRTNLVLVLLALVAAAYAYFDRRSVSDSERKDRETDVLPAYRRQDVSKVELLQGDVRLAFERRADGDAGDATWWITSPREERADAGAVDKLLSDFEFAGFLRKVDPGAAHGLDAPRVKGSLTMGSLVYRFALGDEAPTPQGASYFRVEGEGSFVVSRDFATSLLKGPDTYRQRTVVPYLSLELSRLAVKGRGASFVIERMDAVSFRLPELGLRASRETLDRVWGALAEGRAESFLPDDDAARALGADPIRIEMKPTDGSRKEGELLLGGSCPGHAEDVVAVRRAPTPLSACVPKGTLPGLLVTSAELVDRRLFAARGDETAELTLESIPANTKVEIARKGTGWHQRSPVDHDLTSEEVDAANELATALGKGEGSDVVPGDPKAPFAARARVRLTRADGKGEEVVELGPPSPAGGSLVRRMDDGATLRVSETLARRLVPSAIALRGKALFVPSLEGKLARGLDLRCEGNEQRLTRNDSGWSFERPSGYAVDSAGTADLVNLVARAQADAWVADADDGSFGFGGEPCSITLSYDQDGGPLTVGVVFGRAAEGGGYFAHLLGQAGVFLAPRSLHDDAGRPLVDPTGFHVDSTQIEAVTLSRGGSRLVLTRRGGKLVMGDGGGEDVADKVSLAVEALRADDVVHLGPARPVEGFSRSALDVRVRTTNEAGAKEVHFLVGDSALILRERMFYARLDGVDATFAIARDKLAPLLDAL